MRPGSRVICAFIRYFAFIFIAAISIYKKWLLSYKQRNSSGTVQQNILVYGVKTRYAFESTRVWKWLDRAFNITLPLSHTFMHLRADIVTLAEQLAVSHLWWSLATMEERCDVMAPDFGKCKRTPMPGMSGRNPGRAKSKVKHSAGKGRAAFSVGG